MLRCGKYLGFDSGIHCKKLPKRKQQYPASNQRNWNLCIDGVIHHQDGFEEAHDEQKADDTYEEKTYPFIEVHLVSFVVHIQILNFDLSDYYWTRTGKAIPVKLQTAWAMKQYLTSWYLINR